MTERSGLLGNLDRLDASFPSTPHHVGSSAAARECHNKVGPAFIEHALVADRPSLATEPIQST
jgi:hypothetical protein